MPGLHFGSCFLVFLIWPSSLSLFVLSGLLSFSFDGCLLCTIFSLLLNVPLMFISTLFLYVVFGYFLLSISVARVVLWNSLIIYQYYVCQDPTRQLTWLRRRMISIENCLLIWFPLLFIASFLELSSSHLWSLSNCLRMFNLSFFIIINYSILFL